MAVHIENGKRISSIGFRIEFGERGRQFELQAAVRRGRNVMQDFVGLLTQRTIMQILRGVLQHQIERERH